MFLALVLSLSYTYFISIKAQLGECLVSSHCTCSENKEFKIIYLHLEIQYPLVLLFNWLCTYFNSAPSPLLLGDFEHPKLQWISQGVMEMWIAKSIMEMSTLYLSFEEDSQAT